MVRSMEAVRTRSRRRVNFQNFQLVWLDRNINDVDYDEFITQLKQILNTVKIFTDVDECIDFITNIEKEQIIMMISEELSADLLSTLQDICQINSIYILCENEAREVQSIGKCSKVKGVYTAIASICEVIKPTVQDYDSNWVSISFIKKTDDIPKQNLDELDQSFMYTQILKEILLTIDFQQQDIDDFITYYCEQSGNNEAASRNAEKLRKEYQDHKPIWWYTYLSFLYEWTNRALRTMEVDLILKLGFFIRDLHNDIAALHIEQSHEHCHPSVRTVYRGQGLSQTDFDQLVNTTGGLISFNNFLSTSSQRDVALQFAESNQTNPDHIGVLFEITVDTSINSYPFANIKQISNFDEEEEFLFSMHSVFRIGEVQPIDENHRIWRVELTLTNDNDPQLHALTEYIREETRGSTGWSRLGKLMVTLGHFNKAKELYETLLKETTDEYGKTTILSCLGQIAEQQGRYTEAIAINSEVLNIRQKVLPPNHLDLAIAYSNIALVYHHVGDYLQALAYDEKAVAIKEEDVSANHSDLATSYNNIGTVYIDMGQYSNALAYHKKALNIYQQSLPPNHPTLAHSCTNIGSVYTDKGDYPEALSYHEKALIIYQKSLPPNHPRLANSYNNIVAVYYQIDNYLTALSYYQKAFEIQQKTLPESHPDLASSYNNIGMVYDDMGEYLKALSFYAKALEIQQKTLPPNHPDFGRLYNSIGKTYYRTGEYSKALSYYEQALEIEQTTLPSNHPSLAVLYDGIGLLYTNMSEYAKAISYYEKSIAIKQNSLPVDHPDLSSSYNNMGLLHIHVGDYRTAISYYEKVLEILKNSLPLNSHHLATTYSNIGSVYNQMIEYSKALSYYEKALAIRQRILSSNHPDLAISYNNIGVIYHNIDEFSKALRYYENALHIWTCSLPANHPSIQAIRENIELVKNKL